MNPLPPVLVMGAGAWGTALAIVATRAGHPVYLWGRDSALISAMTTTRENPRYLSGITLPRLLHPITDLTTLPPEVTTAIIATPLQATRATVALAGHHGITAFGCAAKGIELDSLLLVHEVVLSVAGAASPVAILSGPNFAREVAEGRPAALTVAARDANFGRLIVGYLHGPGFRPYVTDDLVGVAVGGAVKNVLAIAAGIADGLGLGANSRAALITRGLAEIARLGMALGGRMETFMGLSGLGDLVLTCTDDQSRNRRFGLALGHGQAVRKAERDIGLVEGIATAAAVIARASSVGVEMPIAAQVARTLGGECTPAAAVHALMTRELGAES